jgi:hypothetical protein
VRLTRPAAVLAAAFPSICATSIIAAVGTQRDKPEALARRFCHELAEEDMASSPWGTVDTIAKRMGVSFGGKRALVSRPEFPKQ